jgi:transketolase
MPLKFDLSAADLSAAELTSLKEMRARCARRILLSTSLAASGHPGGSLSSLDMLLTAYGILRHDPKNPRMEERDRFVASIGHISPGVYSVLAENGYFSEDDFLAGFRRTGSGFPGHIESIVPGVEWDTGNLGQGLSAAVGMAHAFKLKGLPNRVFCLMGDGEQQKGQITEAIRHAVKYKLDNLTVLIDRNKLQICGSTEDIMPQCMQKLYGGLGFNTVKLENGHDCNALYKAMRDAYRNISGVPTVLIAHTVMGKGISFMENKAKYHGSPLPPDDLAKALAELGVANDFECWQARRKEPVSGRTIMPPRAD